MLDVLIPAGYRACDAATEASLKRREAWSSYDLAGDDDEVLIHWRTNDDLDHGVPTAYSHDTYTIKARDGESAIDRALRVATSGGSRHGIGQACFVRLNGTLIEQA